MLRIDIFPDGLATWNGRRTRCRLGRSGVRLDKREGDGATPAGSFRLRRVLWREDRLPCPLTQLPCAPLRPADGWCDESRDPSYNRPVTLPYPASAESLWREDRLYDVIVIIGHNDSPPVPGAGSAVFLHVARLDGGPTAGCVAFEPHDLLSMLREADSGSTIRIHAAESGVG